MDFKTAGIRLSHNYQLSTALKLSVCEITGNGGMLTGERQFRKILIVDDSRQSM